MTAVRVPFEQAVLDVTGGNQRLLTTEYKPAGAIPVIDQGQAEIAGFTDDLSAACRRDGPVILFGDHTRTFKFVDFDFALGADGVKVLKPLPGFDARFLFHFLKTVRLPGNLGYSRHFKYLKECSVPKPEPEVQRRIATILDKADSLRRKRQQAIRLTDDFLRATFVDLFGDPVTNSRGWPTQPLASLGTLDRGVSKHRPRNDPSLLGGDYPLIQTGDVANCDGYIRAFTSTYSEKGLRQSKLWPEGTLCITIAANIAKTGILLFPACFPDSVVGFSAADRPTVEYVRFWLSFLQKTLEANAPASAQKNINLAILRELQIPVPPRDRVERFAAAVQKVEAIRTAQRQAVDEGQQLHRALEHALLTI